MKKPIIILVAALVLAGGSMGTFLAVKNKKDAETSQSEAMRKDNHLFSFNSDDISKIEFDLKDGSFTTEKSEDGTWKVTEGDDFTPDETYLQLVSTYTSDLTAETSFGKADDSKKAMYGLDDPITIKLFSETDTYELYIGDKSPTGEYYYVMTSEKPNVYAIDSYKGTSLVPDKLILKSKDLTLYENNEIDTITVKNKNGDDYVLTYDPDGQFWDIEKKYELIGADRTAISSMVNNLVRLEAEEMLEENFTDKKSLGFDDPDSQIIIKGLDGKEHSILVKAMKDDDTYSYVLNEDDNQLELYYSSNIDLANATVFDYTPKKISGADIYGISGFDIKEGAHSDEFTLSANDRTCTMSGKDVDISNSEGYTLLQNFYNSFSQIPMAGIDIHVKPELEDPVLSVVYHLTDGKDTTIDITNADGKYYIFKDGKYTGAYADETRFEGRSSIEEFYLKFIAYSIK